MKILYISQYYFPETGAGAARAMETARPWVKAGHDVSVLTAYPNYPTGIIPWKYKKKMLGIFNRETIDGVKVIRVPVYPTAYRNFIVRFANYVSFFVMGVIRSLFIEKCDVVVATSPPIFVGLVGWFYSLVKSVPLCFEVRDLWPESLMATTPGSEKTLSYKVIKAMARFLYARAARVTVVTSGFKTDLMEKYGVPAGKIDVKFNGADTNLFFPQNADGSIRDELGIRDKFVVTYIGTIGLSHGIEDIIHIADLLKNYHDIVLLIIGEGPGKCKALQIKEKKNLRNVIFLDNQERERVPAFINASDVCLVPMIKSEVFKTRIPVKIFEIMACSKPIVAALEGEAARILTENNTALVVEPEDDYQLTNAILKLYNDDELRRQLGENGRQVVESSFSRVKIADDYIGTLESIRT